MFRDPDLHPPLAGQMHVTLGDFVQIDLGRERRMTFTKESRANYGPRAGMLPEGS